MLQLSPHFELVFAYGLRNQSNLINLHEIFQFSKCHLLKKLSFPHLSQINWPLKHKLESRLLGEISVTSDMQMTPPLWQKAKKKELKILLMKVKEGSENVGLKLKHSTLDAPPHPCSCGRRRQTGSAWEGQCCGPAMVATSLLAHMPTLQPHSQPPASILPQVLEGAAPTPPPCFHLEPVSYRKPWKVCLNTTPQMFLFYFVLFFK